MWYQPQVIVPARRRKAFNIDPNGLVRRRTEEQDVAFASGEYVFAGLVGWCYARDVADICRAKKAAVTAIPKGDEIAARGGDGYQLACLIGSDASGIMAHAALDVVGRVQCLDAATAVDCRQRHVGGLGTFILHRDGDPAISEHRQMPDAELVLRQARLIKKPAVGDVGEGEGRGHTFEIELGTPLIGMGADAAIGDGKRLAIRHQDQLMRPDAMGRILADSAIAVRGVVEADFTLPALIVVLGGEQSTTVMRQGTVTVEVAAGGRVNAMQCYPRFVINYNGKPAWPAREHHHMRSLGVKSHRMSATGERQAEVGTAHLVESGHMVFARRIRSATDEERTGMTTDSGCLEPEKAEQAASGTTHQSPPIDMDHLAGLPSKAGAFPGEGWYLVNLNRKRSNDVAMPLVAVGFVEADGQRGGVGEGAGDECAQRFDFLQELLDLFSCFFVPDGVKET